MSTSLSNPSVSLETKVSGNSGERVMPEMRSKKRHDNGHGGYVDVTEMRSKRVHDKGGCSDVQYGKRSGEGQVDVVIRHQCILEPLYSLNIELVEV